MRKNAKIVEIYHGVVISENKSIFLGPIQRWVQQSHTKLLGQRRKACFVFVFVVILFEVELVGLVFSTRVVIDCGQKKLNYMVARNYTYSNPSFARYHQYNLHSTIAQKLPCLKSRMTF